MNLVTTVVAQDSGPSAVDWLTQHVVKFIEANQLVSLVLILAGVVGTIYGIWRVASAVLSFRKDVTEIRKTAAEATKFDFENLQHLHLAEEKHAEQGELLNLFIAELVGALSTSTPASKVVELRESLISQYCQCYLPTLGRYLDYYQKFYDRRTCRDLVQALIVKEIQTAQMFQSVVNEPTMLSQLHRQPLLLTRSSFAKVWRFCAKNTAAWQLGLRKQIKNGQRAFPNDVAPAVAVDEASTKATSTIDAVQHPSPNSGPAAELARPIGSTAASGETIQQESLVPSESPSRTATVVQLPPKGNGDTGAPEDKRTGSPPTSR
jgi:hypothetical protein